MIARPHVGTCRVCHCGAWRLMVIFLRAPRAGRWVGTSRIVCDGCLESLQRVVMGWTACELPASVRS